MKIPLHVDFTQWGHGLSLPHLFDSFHHSSAHQNHIDFLFTPSKPRGNAFPPVSMAMVPFLATNVADEEEEEVEEPSIFRQHVPTAMKILAVADTLVAAAVFKDWMPFCQKPLRNWLLGSLLLGAPMTYLIDRLGVPRCQYKKYRLVATALRHDENIDIKKLSLFLGLRQHGCDLEASEYEEQKQGESTPSWEITLKESTPVNEYFFVLKGQPGNDPFEWRLEGSHDGATWVALHKVKMKALPKERNYRTPNFKIPRSDAFRQAFAAELLAGLLSVGWLFVGTVWIMHADYCVDSSPFVWWASYLTITGTWSAISTAAVCMIVASVVSLLFQPQKST
eukprot:GEMP01046760.1.p1 GENE.GEMP01046760.1~~GEMP01046760.1.p1  ORF type:complete len:337 (+),score=85.67 GEMP01046760.1:224-1234(+)